MNDAAEQCCYFEDDKSTILKGFCYWETLTIKIMASVGAHHMGDPGPHRCLAEEVGGGQAAPHSEDPSCRPGRRNKR